MEENRVQVEEAPGEDAALGGSASASELASETPPEVKEETSGQVAEKLGDEAAPENVTENADLLHGQEAVPAGAEGVVDEKGGSSGPRAPSDPGEFMKELESFFQECKMEFKIPKFYGVEVDLFKLWNVVASLGGYEKVTAGKQWRVVGDHFDPPKSCTTLSWSFRGFYEKGLLDFEKHVGVDPTLQATTAKGGSAEAGGSRSAKRAAATRAMQGWRNERGEGGAEGEPSPESRGASTPTAKRQRRLVEGEDALEGDTASQGAAGGRSGPLVGGALSNGAPGRTKGGAQPNGREGGAEGRRGKAEEAAAVVTDEGPPADWVRINVRRSPDCFEVYALVPGLLREEVRVQCEGGGKVVIAGEPEQPENPWGVTPFKKVILLPSSINAHQTSAVVTLHGQLYVRAPLASAPPESAARRGSTPLVSAEALAPEEAAPSPLVTPPFTS